jgi:hypothetical protein
VQTIFSVLGLLWVIFLGPVVRRLAALPDDAWRTNLPEVNGQHETKKDGGDGDGDGTKSLVPNDKTSSGAVRNRFHAKNQSSMSAMESGVDIGRWKQAKNDGKIE